MREQHDRGYRELLGDLGVGSFFDLRRRYVGVKAFLPRLWKIAETILAADPEIEDDGAPATGVRC